MSQLTSVILAVGSVVLGFGLQAWKDRAIREHEDEERERSVFSALIGELALNIAILSSNLDVVKANLRVVDSNQLNLRPIVPTASEVWSASKMFPPKKLQMLGSDLSLSLRAAYVPTVSINATVQSRETHRIHNQAYSNFSHILKFYDQTLMASMTSVVSKMEEAVKLLERELAETSRV